MRFRLVPRSVTLNDLERRIAVISRNFSELVYDVVVKQLYLGFKIYLLQRADCKRCTSYGNSVRLSVSPSIRPSVRPSVCHTPVLCQNDCT